MSTTDRAVANQARREIARRFVSLFKEFVGRGPTTARAYFEENLVLVLLEDTLTPGERKLAEEARLQLVRELRRSFEGTMRDRMYEVIEEETGRRVRAMLSDHSVLPDYAIDAFVLEPLDEPDGTPLRPGRDGLGNGNREISRGMVALFKEYVGRGPTRARTFINEDMAIVLLEDTLTKAEQSLAEADRASMVRDVRRHFQGTMREDAIELVERALDDGRRVKAFLSDNAVFPDYAIELFLLEPPDAD